jgi:hypothetical protein
VTPIERAARALKDEADRIFQLKQSNEIHVFMAGKEGAGWESLVRAVISAIREPSEGMRDAAYTVEAEFRTTMGNLDRGYSEGDGIWQAMIDALLAEGKY